MEVLQELHNKGVTLTCRSNPFYAFIDGIQQFETSRQTPKDNSVYIGTMGLVGMFALSVAVKEQYDKIYLLGYDFGTKSLNDIQTHFYQGQINVDSSGIGNPAVYLNEDGTVKRDVKEYEVYKYYQEIYNVSINSNIEWFPKIDYNEFFIKLEENNG